jgi:hypothetical protein
VVAFEVDIEDRQLLDQAVAWLHAADPQALCGDWPRALAQERGVDFATAALYVDVRENKPSRPTFKSEAPSDDARQRLKELTVAVAPGAFYREHPWTGADGAAIREAAGSLGCRTEMIPTASVGTLAANAQAIVSWLADRIDERIVLVSLSKGGADVKVALAHRQGPAAFRNVAAWINIGGVTDGSPMVAWLLKRPLATWVYRFLFWRRGRDFQFIRDLDRRPGGPLDAELERLPDLQMIHVIGFPLRRHLRDPRAARWHRRLAPWGPNDTAAILADACKLPGIIVPIWGADHFGNPRVNLPQLTSQLLRGIAEASSRPASDDPPHKTQRPVGAAP